MLPSESLSQAQKVEYFQVRPIGQFNHDAARNFYNLLNCYSARSVTFHQTTIDQGIFYFETWLINLWDGFRAEYSRIWNAMKFQTLPEEQKRYLNYLSEVPSPQPQKLPKFNPAPESFFSQIRAAHLNYLCLIAYKCEINIQLILSSVTTQLYNLVVTEPHADPKTSKKLKKFRKFVNKEIGLVSARQNKIAKFRAVKLTWKKFNKIEAEFLKFRQLWIEIMEKLRFKIVWYGLANEFPDFLNETMSSFEVNGRIYLHQV